MTRKSPLIPTRKNFWPWLGSAAFVVAAAAFAAWFARGALERWQTARLVETCERATEAEMQADLLRWAQANDDGVAFVAAQLAHERPETVRAAGRALHELLDRWSLERAAANSSRVERLANALADDADRFDSGGRGIAGELAVRLLKWRLDDRYCQPERVIAQCERVLRINAAAKAQPDATARHAAALRQRANEYDFATSDVAPVAWQRGAAISAGGMRDDVASVRLHSSHDLLRGARYSPEFIAALPGGNLPIDAWDLADVPGREPQLLDLPAHADAQPLPGADVHGALAQPSRRTSPDDRFDEPSPFPGGPLDAESEEPGLLPQHLSRPLRGSTPATEESDQDAVPPLRDRFTRTNDYDVILCLHAADPQLADAAQEELAARGFSELERRLAKALADADPKRRIEVAEALSTAGVRNPRPWLLWLSRDGDPRVRALAVSLMATCNDLELAERLRSMQQEETDAEVRRRLERVLGNERKRLR